MLRQAKFSRTDLDFEDWFGDRKKAPSYNRIDKLAFKTG